MSSPISYQLCLSYTNDYVTISQFRQDQLGTIICGHLSLKIDDDDPFSKSVCQSCVDRVVGFDEFYKIVAENQKSLRNIQPIIIFRDETADTITHSTTFGEYAIMEQVNPDDCLKDSLTYQSTIDSEKDSPIDEHDDLSCSTVETDDEHENNDMDAKYPTALNNSNSQEFPTQLVRDNKLIFRGQELINLIQKFYTLRCDQCPR